MNKAGGRHYLGIQKIIACTLASAFLLALIMPTGRASADDTYLTWKRLFNNTPQSQGIYIQANSSEFVKNGWLLDTQSKVILGPRLLFKYDFPSGPSLPNGDPGKGTEYTWDHIPAPDGNYPVFLLRSCNVSTTATSGIDEASCIYSEIYYKENYAAVSGSFWSNFWAWVGEGAIATIPGGTTFSPSIAASTAQSNNALNAAGDKTDALVMLRKNSDGNYFKSRTQDILGAKWFKMNDPSTAVKVDWLQRPDQKISLWYRGDKINGNGSGTPVGPANTVDPDKASDDGTDTIKKWFSGGTQTIFISGVPVSLPVSNSFFKIGEVTVTKPASYDAAAADSNSNPVNANGNVEQSTLPECSMTDGNLGSGSFMGCIARLVYYVIYWPIAWFAGLMGTLFDFFLGYSLMDSAYRADFAVRGWQVVRDISNIFFIIILVYTGLATVFGSAKTSMKQVIPNLILNALLINFSLFATRVVIDISNVVARVFYNSVHVCKGPCEKQDGKITNFLTGPGGYKSLSTKIVSSFNPQRIFSSQILSQAKALPTSTNAGVSAQDTAANRTSSEYAGYFIVVSLIAALILFTVAMMFWKTAFFFLGRVIGLYLAMIFAPFAFLGRKMPLISSIKQLSWDDWTGDLVRYAMLAPIFVFFLYIIYSFIDTDFITGFTAKATGASFLETVVYIAIPMLIVYFMIQQGVKIAETYAGEMGKRVQSFAQKATGVVGGAALGVTALAGSRVVGSLAKRMDEGRIGAGIRNLASKSGVFGAVGRGLQRGVNKTRSGSFDFRQTSIGQKLFKEMDIDTNQKGVGMVGKALSIATLGAVSSGLKTEDRKGGFDADVKKRTEQRMKEADLLQEKASDKKVEKWNKKEKAKRAKKVDKAAEDAMIKEHGKEKVEKMKIDSKEKYAKEKAQKVAAVETTIPPVKEVRSAKEMTVARLTTFSENLKKGGPFTQAMNWLASKGVIGEVSAAIIGGTIGAAIGQQTKSMGDASAGGKIEKEAIKQIKKEDAAKEAIQRAEDKLKKAKDEFEYINNALQSAIDELAKTNQDFANKKPEDLTPGQREALKRVTSEKKAKANAEINRLKEELDTLRAEIAQVDEKKDPARKAMLKARQTNLVNRRTVLEVERDSYDDLKGTWDQWDKANEKVSNAEEQVEKKQRAENDLKEAKNNKKKEDKEEEKKK